MLLANTIAPQMPHYGWSNIDEILRGIAASDVMLECGFSDRVTSFVCLGATNAKGKYLSRLFTAFEQYDRYALSCGMDTDAKQISPRLHPAVLDEKTRIVSYPEERHLYLTGNLPLPCPKCSEPVYAIGRWPGSSCSEVLEYDCCGGLFYYLRPFREWGFDKAVYVPDEDTVYHHDHLYARKELLQSAFFGFCRKLAKAVEYAHNNGFVNEQHGLGETLPVVLGRGENNPGHVLFEDLAGMYLLDRGLRRSGNTELFSVIVQQSARWFEPLLDILPSERIVDTIYIPNGISSIMKWCLESGQPLVHVKVHPCWPHTTPGSEAVEDMRRKITALPERYGVSVKKRGVRVLFPLRVHNRSWEPQAENVGIVMDYVRERCPDATFVLHGVGTCDSAFDSFRRMAEVHDDVTLLFDAELPCVLAEYGAADLVLGPVGSGFWWAGMYGTPSITIHPENNPDNVELGGWVLPPNEGCKPFFLSLVPEQQCVCLEECAPDRKAYEALSLPVSKVLEAVQNVLTKEFSR